MPILHEILEYTSLPVIVKPNAGLPVITETGAAVYSMGEEEFARNVQHLKECGASVIGGCCGTTPDYILRVRKSFAE